MNAAACQDDLPPVKQPVLARDLGLDADRAPPFDQYLLYRGAADDREIGATADGGIEITNGRRRALVGPVAHRHGAVAIAEVRVHIGDEGELALLRVREQRA